MKLFLLLVILSEGLCLASAEEYVWGTREPNDLLLETRRIQFSWEGSWQSYSIRFPIEAEYNVPITCVTISNKLDHHGQTADIADGGIGQLFVWILVYSPAFRGIDYEVNIYGKAI